MFWVVLVCLVVVEWCDELVCCVDVWVCCVLEDLDVELRVVVHECCFCCGDVVDCAVVVVADQ